jgi:tetratricopeptide (TPR) repeat protein
VLTARAALIVLLLTRICIATEAQDEKARELFARGQEQFRAQKYEQAIELFKQAYLLSPQPAFLYNMASALEGLGRPKEAAEKLRAYLRAAPAADPERPQIEDKIRALDEAQRQISQEPPAPPAASPAPAPAAIVIRAEAPPPPRRSHKTAIAVAVSVAAAVVLAVGLGVGLGLHDWHTPSTLDTHPGTP